MYIYIYIYIYKYNQINMCTCVRYGKETEKKDTHRQYFSTSMALLILIYLGTDITFSDL